MASLLLPQQVRLTEEVIEYLTQGDSLEPLAIYVCPLMIYNIIPGVHHDLQ